MKNALRTAVGVGIAAAVLAPALPASAAGPDELYVQGLYSEVSPSRLPYLGSIAAGEIPLFCEIGGVGNRPTVWSEAGFLPADGSPLVRFGRSSDLPLCGDWDGDGEDEVAVRRGNRYFLASENVDGGGDVGVVTFGRDSDVVLVGDWDGDGDDELGLKRGNVYFFSRGATDGGAGAYSRTFGRATDLPTTGRFALEGDHDGLALRRGQVTFVSEDRVDGRIRADFSFRWGRPTDVPLPRAAQNDEGPDLPAVLRLTS